MKPSSFSLRTRLILALMLGLLLALGAGGVCELAWMRSRLSQRFDATLHARAQALAVLVELSKDGKLYMREDDGATAAHLTEDERPDFYVLRELNGASIVSSRQAKGHEAQLPHSKAGDEEVWSRVTLSDGRQVRTLAWRWQEEEGEWERKTQGFQPPGPPVTKWVEMTVGEDMAQLDAMLLELALTRAAMLGVLMLALGLWVAFAVRRTLAPIDTLANHAALLDGNRLDFDFPTAGLPPDLQPIAARLNELLARMRTAMARERRFGASVAHELRTPITELRTLAEVYLRHPAPAAQTQAALADAFAIACHMQGVVNGLLAMLNDGTAPVKREDWDISAALLERVRFFSQSPTGSGLGWDPQIPDSQWVQTDPALLRAILDNLLSNAVSYAPPGSRIGVRLESAQGCARIVIDNEAPDLTQADLKHLSEPFWRHDTARTVDGHVGLGLSLVESYAGRLGAQTVFTHQNGRFAAALRLPAAASAG